MATLDPIQTNGTQYAGFFGRCVEKTNL